MSQAETLNYLIESRDEWMARAVEAEKRADRFQMTLESIADQDFRGNRSPEMQIAYYALRDAGVRA